MDNQNNVENDSTEDTLLLVEQNTVGQNQNNTRKYGVIGSSVTILTAFFFVVVLFLIFFLIFIFVPTLPNNPLDRAKYLATITPLIDGHNDYAEKLLDILSSKYPKFSNRFNFRKKMNEEDFKVLRKHGIVIQSDYEKFSEGKLSGQFWSVFDNCKINGTLAVEKALDCFAVIHDMFDTYPDIFQPIRHSSEIMRAHYEGKLISLIGVEGGQMINSNLAVLREFYELGSRYMTLTHNCNTKWADSCCDPKGYEHNGLTEFGKDVIREMNKLGMIVDLSHTSPMTMKDAFDVTKAPVMFSHSNAFSLCGHERNVRDDMLERLKENNGIIMVVFYNPFVSEFERIAIQNITEKYPNNRTEKIFEWEREHPDQMASISFVADHVDYIKNKIGVQHIGIGSDFDGTGLIVSKGLEDTSKFMYLFEELIKRKYTDEEVSMILGGNIIRVLNEVERISGTIKNSTVFF